MKIHRIWGMVLRYMYYFRHSYDRISDVFYWPTMDFLMWGLTSAYFSKHASGTLQIMPMILSGLMFWIIVWRAQYEITVNALQELWDGNVINLFVAPLKFWEWITSLIIVGIIKSAVSFLFAMSLAFILYKVRLYFYGFYFVPLILLLIMTGWWVGFFVAGLILRYGSRVQMLAWTTVVILSPFSGVFYPLSILPPWAQALAKMVPTSYIFEGGREILYTGTLSMDKLLISFSFNAFYLIICAIFLKRSFDAVLKRGLITVY